MYMGGYLRQKHGQFLRRRLPEMRRPSARRSAPGRELAFLNQLQTIGASGAIYGVLLAFGMLFPNMLLYIMFIPVPIKAKWMVIGWSY